MPNAQPQLPGNFPPPATDDWAVWPEVRISKENGLYRVRTSADIRSRYELIGRLDLGTTAFGTRRDALMMVQRLFGNLLELHYIAASSKELDYDTIKTEAHGCAWRALHEH